MEARPSKITEFFDGTKQMMVPLFQRPYEWTADKWETLWADLMEQYERSDAEAVATHFTGAIVTAPQRSVPVGVNKFLVIDGQQRLTTIAVLICAMRSYFPNDSKEYRRLSKLLVNEDYDGLDYYKLLPTQPDREPFQALVDGKSFPRNRFVDAFEFFKKKLSDADADGEKIDLERLVNAVQSRMTVVNIHLGDADDPYLIFESLNAKGAPLTQADLIRNYLLLRLHGNAQQKSYEEDWLPMQKRLEGDHLTEFMRQFLMMTGEEVAKSSIYAVLKKRLLAVSLDSTASELTHLRTASELYAQVIGLTPCGQPSIQVALARLRRWDIATANPFILKLLEARTAGTLSDGDVARCLSIIESFAVRRTVCGVPTNQLKRIFLNVAKDMPTSEIPAWLEKSLAAGNAGRRWPKDEEFRESLLRYRAYVPPTDRCRFLLETLEAHHAHKEPASFERATIEHIMPRTLTDDWRQMLGQDAASVHEKWLDVLGNLTLTGYNSELSNSPFQEKKALLIDSNFSMNGWIAQRQKWTETEIRERTEILFERAKQIWARPE